MKQLLVDQQVKSSPSYHQWLTPQQFGAQFGPGDEDIQTASEWLTNEGFQVNRVAAGRSIIEFSGTAGQVRHSFHTEIHNFVRAGESHWANQTDPQIPAALAPVVAGIVSLNNFPRKQMIHRLGAFSRQKGSGELRPLFTYTDKSGTWYALGPSDFATIYNVQPLWQAGIDGTGQRIAIVSETNINLQDVRDFRNLFGLPPNDPQIILNGPDPGIVDTEEGEADLDVQWAGAVARNATIQLVVSQTTSASQGTDLSALYIIDNNLAPVMSESYGQCESSLGNSGNTFFYYLWEQAAAQGITVTVSAGDAGSAGCDVQPSQTAAQQGLAVSGIASTPFNVAVGGTEFDDLSDPSRYWNAGNQASTQASAKSYIPETTWNDTCAQSGELNGCTSVSNSGLDLTAAGGGPSNCETSSRSGVCTSGYDKPPWQSGPGVPNDGVRDIPDVSFFSSDGQNGSFYVMCQASANPDPSSSCNLDAPYQNFQGVGGTSAAAPAFAGIMAMVNQKTGERQGNANFVLYKLAAQSGASCTSDSSAVGNSSCTFYDLRKGNISVACKAGSGNCSNASNHGYGLLVDPAHPNSPAWTTTANYDLASGLGSVNAANLVKNWTSVSFSPTTTTLSLSPTTITHGQSVNVSINVHSSSGVPSGAVSLIGGLANQAQGIDFYELSNGSVAGTTVYLPGGSYGVTAHYAGDGTFGTSNSSPAIAVKVNKENSQTQVSMITFDNSGNILNSNALSATYGSPYVMRVDVTNTSGQQCSSNAVACPTGNVAVTDNGNPPPQQGNPPGQLPSGTYTLNSGGYFEDNYIQFGAGQQTLVGKYQGDNSYNASQSSSKVITISQASTTSTLSFKTQPNSTFILTAEVDTTSNGAAPSGSVRFLNGGTPVPGTVTYAPITGSSTASATLLATLTASFYSNVTITAQYSGDVNYTSSNSSPIVIQGTPVVPMVSSILPISGSNLGNTKVYLSGNNFGSGATVSFGSVAATNVQVVNSSLIIAITGPGSVGLVDVTVTNPGAQPVVLPNAYTYQTLPTAVVPASAMRIPYVVDSVFFRSDLGINNPNPSLANVQITFLDSNGSLVGPSASVTIPSQGYLQIDSILRYLQGTSTMTGQEGSLVLESDQAIQAFASQINNQTGDPSILDGIREGSPQLVLQSAANTGPFRSNLQVLNLSPGQANVTMTAHSRETGQSIGTALANLTIPGNGYLSFDNILQALSVPDSYGPVEIQSTNGSSLVGISQVSGVGAGTSGFFTAQASNSGTLAEMIPFVIDTGDFRTNLGLNNLGPSTANVGVTLMSTNGTPLGTTKTPIQVAPQGMVQINNIVRFLVSGSSDSSVANQQGYLQITSDQTIKTFATQIDNVSLDPSIENSASTGSSHLLLKSSANGNFQSTLVLVNPNDSPVNVMLSSRQGGSPGNGNITGTRTISIASHGFFESNNILADIGAASVFGPIEILANANAPLIAVSRVYSTSGNTSGFFDAVALP
ncbi:MAG: protease pro-enzyme activation domain-containing protein [Terriglobia bacterium]